MLKRFLILLCAIPLFSLTSCASLQNSLSSANTNFFGDNIRVVLISGGKTIREYHVDGTVSEDADSTWFFQCEGHTVRIDGDVLIEPRSIHPANFLDDTEVIICSDSAV